MKSLLPLWLARLYCRWLRHDWHERPYGWLCRRCGAVDTETRGAHT